VRAQEEIRAERDRVFQELKVSVGQLSVELAGRVVGESLDPARHQKLVDQYIDQVAGLGNGDGS
jgi:F-type H+-transporting ATPase subunit b